MLICDSSPFVLSEQKVTVRQRQTHYTGAGGRTHVCTRERRRLGLGVKVISADKRLKNAKQMNKDELKTLDKSEISERSNSLSKADVGLFVQILTEKDDTIRYNAFLILQANSRKFPYVYDFWSVLEEKLESDNSYQRSLGVMLLAENVRWDKDDKFAKTISKYLRCCSDEKFITARQTIQGLETILNATDKYDAQVKQHLSQLSISQYKDNQQRLLTKDIAEILKKLEKR